MTKITAAGIALVLCVGITGCASVGPANLKAKASSISAGQTKQDVEVLLGKPQNRSFRGTDEAWQYCSLKALDDEADFTTIWFSGDSVISVTNHKSVTSHGNCELFFQQVVWR